ncbi:MAG: hypothetical protein QCI38_06940 [Candidatus Thermoplasmatota archaeon]|nr:hypothetical protein [Candidatus Thermoplasmatota archaeon]
MKEETSVLPDNGNPPWIKRTTTVMYAAWTIFCISSGMFYILSAASREDPFQVHQINSLAGQYTYFLGGALLASGVMGAVAIYILKPFHENGSLKNFSAMMLIIPAIGLMLFGVGQMAAVQGAENGIWGVTTADIIYGLVLLIPLPLLFRHEFRALLG